MVVLFIAGRITHEQLKDNNDGLQAHDHTLESLPLLNDKDAIL